MSRDIVVSIFYDKKTGKVLSEKRRLDSPLYPNQIVFPSGTVEKEELADFTKTLLREAKEEFGVVPTMYVCLDGTAPLTTSNGKYMLHLYLITAWEGNIPDEVLDKGNPLIWETLDEVAASPVENRREIIQRVKEFLKSTPNP